MQRFVRPLLRNAFSYVQRRITARNSVFSQVDTLLLPSALNIFFALDKVFGADGCVMNWGFKSKADRDEFFCDRLDEAHLVRYLCVVPRHHPRNVMVETG